MACEKCKQYRSIIRDYKSANKEMAADINAANKAARSIRLAATKLLNRLRESNMVDTDLWDLTMDILEAFDES